MKQTFDYVQKWTSSSWERLEAGGGKKISFYTLYNCGQPKLAVDLIIFITCPCGKSEYLKHKHKLEIPSLVL